MRRRKKKLMEIWKREIFVDYFGGGIICICVCVMYLCERPGLAWYGCFALFCYAQV